MLTVSWKEGSRPATVIITAIGGERYNSRSYALGDSFVSTRRIILVHLLLQKGPEYVIS